MSEPRHTARDTDLALVVVGGGVAGLFAALCAAAEGDVLVLTKGPLLASTSLLAQGGIAAAVGEDDAPSLHAEDTLRTGRGEEDVGEAVVTLFAPIQERYRALRADEPGLRGLLADGAERAREASRPTLDAMYERMGFVRLG
jgi:L-aspartate oxidase